MTPIQRGMSNRIGSWNWWEEWESPSTLADHFDSQQTEGPGLVPWLFLFFFILLPLMVVFVWLWSR